MPIVIKPRGHRKLQTKKTTYMSDEAFADLNQALEDALAFERAERRDLSVMRIEGSCPPRERQSRYSNPKNANPVLADGIREISGGALELEFRLHT